MQKKKSSALRQKMRQARTLFSSATEVHERPGVVGGQPQHVAGLEVTVHPPTGMQLGQLLCSQIQSLHTEPALNIGSVPEEQASPTLAYFFVVQKLQRSFRPKSGAGDSRICLNSQVS